MLAAPETALWSRVGFGAVWIALGLAILLGLGRTLELLPEIIAVLLVIGGLASIYDAVRRGSVSQRVLAAVWGGAQIAFGILSYAWPDVTVLLVALIFGVRTVIFGASLLVRAVRAFVEGRRSVPATGEPARHAEGTDAAASVSASSPAGPARRGRARAAWLATGRYALASLLVALAVGGWWANSWFQDGAQVVDAFYDPPAVVPYEHGHLIRTDDFSGQKPAGADVRRILYTTRDANGQPAVASALVIAPRRGTARAAAGRLVEPRHDRRRARLRAEPARRVGDQVGDPGPRRRDRPGMGGRRLGLLGSGRAGRVPVPDRSRRGAIVSRRGAGRARDRRPQPVAPHRGVGPLAGRARRPVDVADRRRLRA